MVHHVNIIYSLNIHEFTYEIGAEEYRHAEIFCLIFDIFAFRYLIKLFLWT